MNNFYGIKVDLNCKCNIKCIYCTICNEDQIIYDYDPFDVVKEFIKKNILEKESHVRLEFKLQEMFFVYKKVIKIINMFILDSLEKNYTLQLSIVTNGTLLGKQEIQKFFYDYKKYIPSFMISLDGYKDVQDLQRPGSWDRIVENWDFLRKYTNDNITISSCCAHPALNIYASSLIKLLETFNGIQAIFTCLDYNNGYSKKDANIYIKQIKILLKYLRNKNISLLPLYNSKESINNKKRRFGRIYLLSQTIIETPLYENNAINNEKHYEYNFNKERLKVQHYLNNRLNRLRPIT